MLSKRTERQFMKYICKEYENSKTIFVDSNHFKGSTRLSNDKINEVLKKLESNGYISYKKFDDQDRPFIKIEPKGRIYFETLRDERNNFIKGHIITPITVSIATSLLTTIALQELPKLIEWMKQLLLCLVGS